MSETPQDRRPRRGRPREIETPSRITFRLDATLHDRIVQEAEAKGVSVGSYTRQLLLRALGQWPQ